MKRGKATKCPRHKIEDWSLLKVCNGCMRDLTQPLVVQIPDFDVPRPLFFGTHGGRPCTIWKCKCPRPTPKAKGRK